MNQRIRHLLIGIVLVCVTALTTFWVLSTKKMKENVEKAEALLQAKYKSHKDKKDNPNQYPDFDLKVKRAYSSLLTPWNPQVSVSLDVVQDTDNKNAVKPITDEVAVAFIVHLADLNAEQMTQLAHYLQSLDDVHFSTNIALDQFVMAFEKKVSLQKLPLESTIDGKVAFDFNSSIFKNADLSTITSALSSLTGIAVDLDIDTTWNQKKSEELQTNNKKTKQQAVTVLKGLIGSYSVNAEITESDIAKFIAAQQERAKNINKLRSPDTLLPPEISKLNTYEKVRYINKDVYDPEFTDRYGSISLQVGISNKLIDNLELHFSLDDFLFSGQYEDIKIYSDFEFTKENYEQFKKTIATIPFLDRKNSMGFDPDTRDLFAALNWVDVPKSHQQGGVFFEFLSEFTKEFNKHPEQTVFPIKDSVEIKLSNGALMSPLMQMAGQTVFDDSAKAAGFMGEGIGSGSRKVENKEPSHYERSKNMEKGEMKSLPKPKGVYGTPSKESRSFKDVSPKRMMRHEERSCPRSHREFVEMERHIPNTIEISHRLKLSDGTYSQSVKARYDELTHSVDVDLSVDSDRSAEYIQTWVESALVALNRVNNNTAEKMKLDWNETLSDDLLSSVRDLGGSMMNFSVGAKGWNVLDLISDCRNQDSRHILNDLNVKIDSQTTGSGRLAFDLKLDGLNANPFPSIHSAEFHLTTDNEDIGSDNTYAVALVREFQRMIMLQDGFDSHYKEYTEKDKERDLEHAKRVLAGQDKILSILRESDPVLKVDGTANDFTFNLRTGDLGPQTSLAIDAYLHFGPIELTGKFAKEKWDNPESDLIINADEKAADIVAELYTMRKDFIGEKDEKSLDVMKSFMPAEFEMKTKYFQGFEQAETHITLKAEGISTDFHIPAYRRHCYGFGCHEPLPIFKLFEEVEPIAKFLTAFNYFGIKGEYGCDLSYDKFYEKAYPENLAIVKIEKEIQEKGDLIGLEGLFRFSGETAGYLCNAEYELNSLATGLFRWDQLHRYSRNICIKDQTKESPMFSSVLNGGVFKKNQLIHAERRSAEDLEAMRKKRDEYDKGNYKQEIPEQCSRIPEGKHSLSSRLLKVADNQAEEHISLDDADFWSTVMMPRKCREFSSEAFKAENFRFSSKSTAIDYLHYRDDATFNRGDTLEAVSSSSDVNDFNRYDPNCSPIFKSEGEDLETLKKWESDSGITVADGFGLQRCCPPRSNENEKAKCTYHYITPKNKYGDYNSLKDYVVIDCPEVKTILKNFLSRFEVKNKNQFTLYGESSKGVLYNADDYSKLYDQCIAAVPACWKEKNK